METVAKKGVGLEELHMYISMLGDHGLICLSTSHAEISRLILSNFAAIVDKKTIERYFEPTVDEEELDLVLAYRNLGYE